MIQLWLLWGLLILWGFMLQSLPFPGPGGRVANIPSTPFITSTATPTLRNNYDGFVGFKFTVGGAALTVTKLGRMFFTGNTGTHIVKLIAASEVDVSGGSVSIAMTGGTNGQFKYVDLATPIVLSASTTYFLMSQEASGGDQFADSDTNTHTAVATVNGSSYTDGTGHYQVAVAGDNSYVHPNFQYR